MQIPNADEYNWCVGIRGRATHNNTSIITRLSVISSSNSSFPYKLIDEGINNKGGNRLRKLNEHQEGQLKFWERRSWSLGAL